MQLILAFWAGDATLIFGSFKQIPGEYFRVFTGANQCDSTHVSTLEASAAQLQPVEARPQVQGKWLRRQERFC